MHMRIVRFAGLFCIGVSCVFAAACKSDPEPAQRQPVMSTNYSEINRRANESLRASGADDTELIQSRSGPDRDRGRDTGRDRDEDRDRDRDRDPAPATDRDTPRRDSRDGFPPAVGTDPSRRGATDPTLPTPSEVHGVSASERKHISQYYTQEAEQRYLAQDFQGALSLLDYAIELDPGNARAADLRKEIYATFGVGGSMSESRDDEDQALRGEAIAEVDRRVSQGQRLLEEGRYAEAIEVANAAIDVIRWSRYLMDFDAQLQRAREVVTLAETRREEKRLRDASRIKEEQRRQKELQTLAKLERYNDEIRNLYIDAKNLFDRREYAESVVKLNQILRRDPFNEEVIELKRIAISLQRNAEDRDAFEEFHHKWRETFAQIDMAANFPADMISMSSSEYWERVNERANRVLSEQTLQLSKVDIAVRSALEARFVDLNYKAEDKLTDVISDLRHQGRVNMIATNDAGADDKEVGGGALELNHVVLRRALNILSQRMDFEWRVENGAIVIDAAGNSSSAGGISKIFNVADILLNFTVFIPQEPMLGGDAQGTSRWRDRQDPNATTNENQVDADALTTMITEQIDPDSWSKFAPKDGGDNPSIRQQQLVVFNTVENVRRVEALIADIRKAQGLAVHVESRFITIRRDFLEDIGIDFRGIGDSPEGATPQPVPAAMDDVSFGTNNQPQGVGTDNTSGFFFQDIDDSNSFSSDMRMRVESLFDQAVGGRRGGFGLTNRGGMSFQLAFLDNPEINAIIRAVKKGERATLLHSPSVLVFNTQRGYVNYVNEVSYIRDFSITTGVTAAAADPIVDVVRDGIVLDVRPTVSADRRYIMLEMRPTLATLLRPIPTISTTLTAGPPVAIQTPELQLQRLRTTITVPDGGSFLVGGLRRLVETKMDSGVPVLSDIPLIGWLFSRKALITTRQDIVIVVTAKIVDLEEEVERRGFDNEG